MLTFTLTKALSMPAENGYSTDSIDTTAGLESDADPGTLLGAGVL